jgi:type II secretion system protein H
MSPHSQHARATFPRIVAEGAGFTLMELIVVMGIIGMMSAAVVPVFAGSMAKLERDHAVRDFIATLRFAQERAVTDTREYRLVLDEDGGAYWLTCFDVIVKRKKTFKDVEERQGERMELPERLSFEKIKARKDRKDKLYYISFYPNGACDEASIVLQHDDGRRVSVSTKGALGQLEVKEDRRG